MPIIQDLPLNNTIFPHNPYVEFHYHNTTELYKYLLIYVSKDPLFASGFIWTYNDQQSDGIYVRTTFPTPSEGTWYWKVNYTNDASSETPVWSFFVNPPIIGTIIQDLPLNNTIFPHNPYVEFHYHNTTELYKYLLIYVSKDPLFASGFIWTYNDQQSDGIYVRTTFPTPSDGTWYWKVNYTNDASSETPVWSFFVNPPIIGTLSKTLDNVTLVSIGTVEKLIANFIGNPLNFTGTTSVQFTDLSTGVPTSWLWKYRKSGTNNNWTEFSTTQNPTKIFPF